MMNNNEHKLDLVSLFNFSTYELIIFFNLVFKKIE